MSAIPQKARVVIIGGGVIGCSIAYHLIKKGWKDVVLLERKQLTSGTTWHAAGLIAQLRATKNMTKLAKYSQELYGGLEAETGISALAAAEPPAALPAVAPVTAGEGSDSGIQTTAMEDEPDDAS